MLILECSVVYVVYLAGMGRKSWRVYERGREREREREREEDWICSLFSIVYFTYLLAWMVYSAVSVSISLRMEYLV